MKYDEAWFAERAWKSLKKSPQGFWDFSDSVLLYLPSFVEEYVDLQKEETPYSRLVTQPENVFLQTIAESVCADLPDEFDFVDFGPGTEHKEQYFFDACKKLGKTFRYIPVDISQRYLTLASEYAEGQGCVTHPVLSSFEECAEVLPQSSVPRFVSLGLTYGNFDPAYIMPYLRVAAGKAGSAFIETQVRERVDINAVAQLYAPNTGMQGLSHKLRLIGIDPTRDARPLPVDDGVRLWYEVLNVPEKLVKLGMQPHDRILVFQSLRYSAQSFTDSFASLGVAHTLYDVSQPFVGALLKF